MLFDKSVEAFDTYLKANRGLSENTRKAYRGDVEECLLALERLRCRDLNEVTIEDLRMWMAESSKNHAKSSMARKTVAVRGFFAWTHEHGVTTTDPACALMTPKIPDTLPDVLSESQAEQLMERVDEDSETSQPKERTMKQQAIELRDAAMLELLYATGMRVAELVGLDVPKCSISNAFLDARLMMRSVNCAGQDSTFGQRMATEVTPRRLHSSKMRCTRSIGTRCAGTPPFCIGTSPMLSAPASMVLTASSYSIRE